MSDQVEQITADEADEAGLEALLAFIRDSRGFDFTGYKRSSLSRRIRKRMQETGIDNYTDYRDRLESSAEEFGHLFNTILINVTGFFRDAEAWTYLMREVIPELIADTEGSEEIRVWSAGCASGEEAYSLAIAFAEALGVEETVRRVKIYGTDVDDEALRDARAGVYPARALEAMPAELREKYFDRSGTHHTFRPDLRRRVIFGRNDITRDAPISRLDLLVCRNTLMYFNVETQSHVIDRFHFALREGAFLFLGKAEMLLSDSERFEIISMRQRMFRRRPGHSVTRYQSAPMKFDMSGGDIREANRRRQIRELALETAPFAVLGVDADGTVALVNNPMRTMFGLTSRDVGRPLQELEISYRPADLRALITQAYAEHRAVRVNSVERTVGTDEVQYLDIHVQPLWGPDGMGAGVAVMFTDTTVSSRLQLEVKRQREELDTAYEELQSTNEELEAMNDELRDRTDEALHANAFLASILWSIDQAVVVLDTQMRVTAWSAAATELWGLRDVEVDGEYFLNLNIGLPVGDLRDPLRFALGGKQPAPVTLTGHNRRGQPIECEISFAELRDSLNAGKGVILVMNAKLRGQPA